MDIVLYIIGVTIVAGGIFFLGFAIGGSVGIDLGRKRGYGEFLKHLERDSDLIGPRKSLLFKTLLLETMLERINAKEPTDDEESPEEEDNPEEGKG